MSHEMSPDEIEHEHVTAMGPSLGPMYNLLYNDVIWLHAKWQQYRKLGETPERVALLNRAASFFFFTVQQVLWNDVVLHLARLVDPPTSLGRADRANLTLLALPAVLTDASLVKRFNASLDEVRDACAFAVDWRNRHIAHRDLPLALKRDATQPLKGASRTIVEKALKRIRAALGLVHGHYLHVDPGFDGLIAPERDADALIHYLLKGIRSEDGRLQRLRDGKPLPEDFE